MSVVPPGGKGMSMRMGRLGQAGWADASEGGAKAGIASAASSPRRRILVLSRFIARIHSTPRPWRKGLGRKGLAAGVRWAMPSRSRNNEASPMPDPTASQALGHFVAGSDWRDIPATLRHEAKRSILNHIGCALGTARDPAVLRALRVMRGLSGAPVATVFGQGTRLDAMGAAFVNAVASNLLDDDDTHLNTVIHPAAPVAPPLFALAEQRGLSGAAVLHAFLLGGEVECRIGNAVSPGHYARGWHITSTCGAFGAAAGCARLLGLSAEQVACHRHRQ